MPVNGAVARQPLVVYAYWPARQPAEPHIGYARRGRHINHGLAGLALSGGLFGLVAQSRFSVPIAVVVALIVWRCLSLSLQDPAAGWYELDGSGAAVAYIGRRMPQHIRGRSGVGRDIFLKKLQLLR